LVSSFIAYATQPGTFPIRYSRGIGPRNGAQRAKRSRRRYIV
jgi:hypothetical protein